MRPEPLILASRSPQRRAILEQLGVDFRVVVPEIEELSDGEPGAVVVENARRKAAAVAERLGRSGDSAAEDGPRILACDTEVVLAGRVLGKPESEAAADRFLRALSGAEHQVVSGIAVRVGERVQTEVVVTQVRFRALGERDRAWYLSTGEWRERAGGYAIQGKGAALVEGIDGDYGNVVGLPVPALLRLAPDLLF